MLKSGNIVEIQASAKINLFLEVMGKRNDGYHDIRSVIVPVSLNDTLVLEGKEAGILTEMEYLPEYPRNSGCESIISAKNLTSRAAEELARAAGVNKGVKIRLQKRIPVGGGLGGGSSDAAAVLHGLNLMWGLGWDRVRLAEVGSRLGSDIPALVMGGAVIAEGVGERITPIELPENRNGGLWLVLVNPGFGVSTADIYSRCTPSLTFRDEMFKNTVFALKERDLDGVAASLFNGLQEAVFRKYPLLGILCSKLTEVGAVGAMVSGSGASVFGLAHDEGHALQIQSGLDSVLDYPVWSKVLRMLPDGVMAAHGPLEARV